MRGKTTIVLLLLMVSSLEANQMSLCGYGDVCAAIVFNQLALSEIREEMREMMTAFNSTRDGKDLVVKGDSSSCLSRNQQLESQISSLESKNQEIMLKDQGSDDENNELRQEVQDLKRAKGNLEDENQRLQQVITKQEERIQNLSISSYMPVDCADIQIEGQTQSGVYTIYPDQTDKSIEVLCDLESQEGGWTVVFTRQIQDEPLDFNESWDNFKNGFGNVNTEYWLGNDLMHVLTSLGSSTMRIDSENYSGEKRWAQWNEFGVADEETKYQMTLGQYDASSTMGDSLSSTNRTFFTTHDNDNDEQPDLNCALGSRYASWGKGGWWYKSCGATRLTAPLKNSNYWDSACWQNWDKQGKMVTSLKALSMKIRRHNYEKLAGLG